MIRALTLAAAAALAAPAFAQVSSQVPTDGSDRDGVRRQQAERPFQQRPAAQDRPADGRRNAGMNRPGDASAVSAEALAQWIEQDNRAELALARFALNKSENDRVKRFAQNMIDAHTKFGEKLDHATGGTSGGKAADGRRTSAYRRGGDLEPPADGDDGTINREIETPAGQGSPIDGGPLNPYLEDNASAGANPPADLGDLTAPAGDLAVDDEDRSNGDRFGADDRTANRPVGPAGNRNAATAADVLAFRANLKQRCGQTLKEQFDRLSPNDFDKAYASQQIGAHLSMIDTLALAEAQAERQGSRPFAELFAAGKTETQQHLTKAIALLNEVTPSNVN